MIPKKTLIFTDLDGTLLDHTTYSTQAAHPMLTALKQKDIPVIATTSKTSYEVSELYKTLNLHTPFIIENGAAVYIPKGYFNTMPEGTITKGNYWVKTFADDRQKYLDKLHLIAEKYANCYKNFSTLSAEQLAELTGLSVSAAKLANLRQYSEPMQWLSNEQTKEEFIKDLNNLGITVLHGGRFIHLSGNCDKGKAMSWLSHIYKTQLKLPSVTTIALGDSGNDIAMLEAADIAVLIKSPVHSYPKLNNDTSNFIYQTKGLGPVGWYESLSFILNIFPKGGLSYG